MTFRNITEHKPVSNPKQSIENGVPLSMLPNPVVAAPTHTPKTDIRAFMPVN